MAMVLFLKVTERQTGKEIILGMAHIRRIDPINTGGCKVCISDADDVVETKETLREIEVALGARYQ